MPARMRRAAVLAVFLGCSAAGAVAQSPTPATSFAPVASSTPADCSPVAARLPRSLDDRTLHVTITDGVAAIDPDELLDPLLAQLDRTRGDVCLVVFRYGDGQEEVAGQLLRISGVDPGSDLGGAFAAAISARLTAYGAVASAAPDMLDGGQVWRVGIVADGEPSTVVIHQMGDTLLLTSDDADMRRLVLVFTVPASPSPVPDTMSPDATETPAVSPD